MLSYPTSEGSYTRLHRAGWSVGEAGFGSRWVVLGYNGENVIRAEGTTQAEAWHLACQQAQALGMLGRASP